MSSFIKELGKTFFLCIPNVALINLESITSINFVGAESQDPECTYVEAILIKTNQEHKSCFLVSDKDCVYTLNYNYYAHINKELYEFLKDMCKN